MSKRSRSGHEQMYLDLTTVTTADGFERLARGASSRHWADYLKWDEHACRNVLSWLLSPHEGHGLGDYFLRRLLSAVLSRCEPDDPAPGDNTHHRIDLDDISLSRAIVLSEVPFPEQVNEQSCGSQIDLLIVEPQSQTLFLIERKDGDKERPEQLQKYSNLVKNTLLPNDWGTYRLFLNSYLYESQTGEREDGWFFLNDQWLYDALDEALDSATLADDLYHSLLTLRTSVFYEDWPEHRHPFYRGHQRSRSEFISRPLIREAIKRLRDSDESRFADSQTPIRKMRTNRIIREYVILSKGNEWDASAATTIARNTDLIGELLTVSPLEGVAHDIREIFDGRLAVFTGLNGHHNKPILSVTLREDLPVDGWDVGPAYGIEVLPDNENAQREDTYKIHLYAIPNPEDEDQRRLAVAFSRRASTFLADLAERENQTPTFKVVEKAITRLDARHGPLKDWLDWLFAWKTNRID